LQADETYGVFITNEGASYSASSSDWLAGFIDSGSNFYFFHTAALTGCSGALEGYYCPASETTLTYTNTSYPDLLTHSTASLNVISPEDATLDPAAAVFSNIAVDTFELIDGSFDWGLPFFFGKTVYVGILGKSSTLGTGPYFAY
jgi:hypothetical protein